MTTPFPFVAGQVLTAAQLNSISELPTRTLTATGNAIAADRYSRVILNGSSISYTVNSATFDVGEVVHLYNINSTAATIAAGTGGVTINAAAGLTLAQYQAATLYAVSATSFILWKSDVTATPGMELISTTTIGSAVSSVTVSNAFSSTYDNYQIRISGGTMSADDRLDLQFGAVTTNYYWSVEVRGWGNTTFTNAGSNSDRLQFGAGAGGSTYLHGVINVSGPNLAKNTVITTEFARAVTGGSGGNSRGYLNDTTQHTAFTVLAGSGTMTGGTIKVYGYRN